MKWDIYCRVVDNFGDIGVCWRLARSLVADHGQQVRLMVDDWATLRRLLPAVPSEVAPARVEGVQLWPWYLADAADLPDAVIEAFACTLPEATLAAMRATPRAPVWINLEYLSAEDWVASCHNLPSPDPATGLAKRFFFPGFTAGTGGLIREPAVALRRAQAREEGARAAWQAEHGGEDDELAARWISLFAYENPALDGLLAAWQGDSVPTVLWVPEGKALNGVAAALRLPEAALAAGARVGRLTVRALPFLPMDEYDRLLALCDLNFVRGEDSFVRAQWAARPFVWQAYVQEAGAHLDKVEAFLARFEPGLPEEVAAAQRRFWLGWNDPAQAMAADWAALAPNLAALAPHAQAWCDRLSATDGLVERLVESVRSEVE